MTLPRFLPAGILSAVLVLLVGTAAAQPFTHPGGLLTQADFTRMKTNVLAGNHPWIDSYDKMIALSEAQTNWPWHPVGQIIRGTTGNNYARSQEDALAIFYLGLRYRITGDANYANYAIQGMDAWSGTMTNGPGGNSNFALAAGLCGYEFACAGEVLRGYSGWSAASMNAYSNFLMLFYGANRYFLTQHNGTCNTHYRCNWDCDNLASEIAIGVFCDNTNIFNEGVAYFTNGIGNGNIERAVLFVHPDGLGQCEESGRDQAHCIDGLNSLSVACQIAWNQGVDLYGYDNNRYLRGLEYVAKYNLGNDVPYVHHRDCDMTYDESVVSSASRGNVQYFWEIPYAHYVSQMGLAAPYTAQLAALYRPDGGPTTWNSPDWFGFTSLTFYQGQTANSAPAPSGLVASVSGRQITLSWWGTATATSYNVKRSTASGGPYTTIAVTGPDNASYVDPGLTLGTTYYYVVSANTPGGESADSAELAAAPDDLMAGTVIGSSGSYNNAGATIANVFDGSFESFYDAAAASGDWAGLDLGAGVSGVVTSVEYAPRPGYASRMIGGVFQGANDPNFTNPVTLYTVPSAPTDGFVTAQDGVLTPHTVSNNAAFRYLRYLGPVNGSCNVAEVRFHGFTIGLNPPATPTDLTAVTVSASQSQLSWAASPTATSYNLKRSTAPGGPYLIIANTPDTNFTDSALSNGVACYYVVSAVNSAGESRNSSEAGVVIRPALAAYLRFDETGGTNAYDATGNGWNGTLVNGAAFVAGYSNNAVNLSSSDTQYVTLPAGIVANLTDFTIAAWVNQSTVSAWSRVFDFGDNTTVYMFLTPRNGDNNRIRFAITTGGNGGEQRIDGASTLPTGWHHVAVTLNGHVGTLYVDGVPVGTNSAMTLNPSSLGWTTQNYLGKSQWSPDPYFNGRLDEFRIYRGALTAGEVATFVTPLDAPTNLTATAGDGQVSLRWNAVPRATGYSLMRSPTNGGPYALLVNLTTTNFTDTGLVNGTTYDYVVAANNAVGQSANSVQISALPLSPISTNLTVTAGSGQLQLSWPADHTGWVLQAQTNPPGAGLGAHWVTLPDSVLSNQVSIPIDPTNGSMFFRLAYP